MAAPASNNSTTSSTNTPAATSSTKRRFEFTEGTSSKFWEVEVSGVNVDVRFGRIGTAGQTQTKTFASADKAKAERDKLVREKVGKGYVEQTAKKDAAKSDDKAAAETPVAKAADAAPTKAASAELKAKRASKKDAAPTPPTAEDQVESAPIEHATSASPTVAKGSGDGWVDAGNGYRLALRDDKLVCQNAKGTILSSVPKEVRDSEVGAQLLEVRDWLVEHTRECVSQVETWMLRSLPVPRALIASVWVDESWRRALENAVVAPLDATGAADQQRAGYLRGVDPKRGVGVVGLDGETSSLDVTEVVVPHPILISELDDFRALGSELGLKQGIAQLFRETFTAPSDVKDDATTIDRYADASFKALNHALGACKKHGIRVSGGNAVCRVWRDGKVFEARYWVGSGDPTIETQTGDLTWVDDRQRALKVREVDKVAVSEGMRMAALVFAARVIEKEAGNA